MNDLLVAGVPLVAVTMAFTEWVKSLGVKGRWVNVSAMLIGVLFAALYFAGQGVVWNVQSAVNALWYGIVLGLTSSGLYDAVGSMAHKEQ